MVSCSLFTDSIDMVFMRISTISEGAKLQSLPYTGQCYIAISRLAYHGFVDEPGANAKRLIKAKPSDLRQTHQGALFSHSTSMGESLWLTSPLRRAGPFVIITTHLEGFLALAGG